MTDWDRFDRDRADDELRNRMVDRDRQEEAERNRRSYESVVAMFGGHHAAGAPRSFEDFVAHQQYYRDRAQEQFDRSHSPEAFQARATLARVHSLAAVGPDHAMVAYRDTDRALNGIISGHVGGVRADVASSNRALEAMGIESVEVDLSRLPTIGSRVPSGTMMRIPRDPADAEAIAAQLPEDHGIRAGYLANYRRLQALAGREVGQGPAPAAAEAVQQAADEGAVTAGPRMASRRFSSPQGVPPRSYASMQVAAEGEQPAPQTGEPRRRQVADNSWRTRAFLSPV